MDILPVSYQVCCFGCSVNYEFSQIEKHIKCYGQKYIEFLTSDFALKNFTIKKINVRN